MRNPAEMYDFVKRIRECYQLLQDELSRKIFKTRLILDYDLSSENVKELVVLSEQRKWMEALDESIPFITHTMEENSKRLLLYGTNVTGRAIAARLLERNAAFYGFCGRRAKEFPDGLMGKPVISPEQLFQHPDDFFVIVSACESADEIASVLKENRFPQDQILWNFKPADQNDHQYFEFPSLFHHGTAFVDGGCLNCRTSYQFAVWCGGEYSRIYAFEPDPVSASVCRENLSKQSIRDFCLIEAGLSDHVGEVAFRTGLYNCSHIVDGNCGGGERRNPPCYNGRSHRWRRADRVHQNGY